MTEATAIRGDDAASAAQKIAKAALDNTALQPTVKSFFDEATFTVTYVVRAPNDSRCAIIDSVLDFDQSSGRTKTTSADDVIEFVKANRLEVDWILETHAHADHLTAAPYLKSKLGGSIAIGENIRRVQQVFGDIFNEPETFARDGRQFDRLWRDGDAFQIGALHAVALHTPGHTPACMSYVIGDAVFTGDTLFMPDYGTARCDFPGGDAATLYRSIQRLLTLPDETRVFLCHDYKAPGRDRYAWESTIGAERVGNVHVHTGVNEADFVAMRTKRDATLPMPKLLLPSVQVNMRAGELPDAETNGVRYLKLPLNVL